MFLPIADTFHTGLKLTNVVFTYQIVWWRHKLFVKDCSHVRFPQAEVLLGVLLAFESLSCRFSSFQIWPGRAGVAEAPPPYCFLCGRCGGRLLESSAAVIERPRQSLIKVRDWTGGRARLFPRPVCGTAAGSEKVLGAQVDDYRCCYGLRLVIGTVDVQAA